MYEESHPCAFTLTVHMTGPAAALSVGAVEQALAAVQQAHPLLSATVRDDASSVAFVHTDAPVALRTVGVDSGWENVVAEEQSIPFERGSLPLWRVTMTMPPIVSSLTTKHDVTFWITIDHRIGDGAAGVRLTRDFVLALNNHVLDSEPVPVPQENLIDSLPNDDETATPATGSSDERLSMPSSTRPFTGLRPEVTSTALNREDTKALQRTAREAHTTVHTLLVAASSVVLASSGREFVRIVTPKDLRRNIGLPDAVALRLLPSRTGTAPAAPYGVDAFWAAVRETDRNLRPTRTLSAVRRDSAMATRFAPKNPEEGENLMLALCGLDMMLTNLGVVDLQLDGAVRPTGFEGLGMSVHIEGEQILGVSTFAGELHMTNTTFDPIPRLLDSIATLLRSVCL